jgi:hypothetical protein
VQLSVRKGIGPWKEGGASLLAGGIIAGVGLFMVWSFLLKSGVRPLESIMWMWRWALTVGLVLAFNGVVQICVRKKTRPWKEGGASSLAGAIIAGVSVFGLWLDGETLLGFFTAGLVLFFNGVMQLSVRKGTGPWKEGGASLLVGGIIAGVSLLGSVLIWINIHQPVPWRIFWVMKSPYLMGSGILIVGLVLFFNGVVQLRGEQETGLWKEGGASLLAGIIVTGVTIGLMFWLRMLLALPHFKVD